MAGIKDVSAAVLKVIFGGGEGILYRSLLIGFSFGAILTVLIGSFMGYVKLSSGFLFYEMQDSTAPWFPVIFVVVGSCVSALGYFHSLKFKEDIVTPIRKMLVGAWQVKFQSWHIEDGHIKHGWVTDTCRIGIDKVGAKLFMSFNVSNSDLFRDNDFEIKNIHIQYQSEPLQLFYFHESRLTVRDEITSASRDIKMPFVGILEFSTEQNEVRKMKGEWYDIDNVVYNLLVLQDKKTGLEELKAKLSDGQLTYKGELEFKRV